MIGFQNVWVGDDIEEAFRIWCANKDIKNIRYVPLIISWGVWLAINSKLFEDEDTLPLKCVVQCINIVSSFS